MLNHEEQRLWKAIQHGFQSYQLWIVAIAIVVLLTISFGTAWQSHHKALKQQASSLYQNMLGQLKQQKHWQQQAHLLLQHHSHDIYASFAALQLAQWEMQQKHNKQAKELLRWVIQYSRSRHIRQLARWRMARVLMTQHHGLQALTWLKQHDSSSSAWQPLLNLTQADALAYMGQYQQAQATYKEVLRNLPEKHLITALVRIQLSSSRQKKQASASPPLSQTTTPSLSATDR